MSVKAGSQTIAGNLALRVQDRLFKAKRTLEGTQEYYDIQVPEGATLGFVSGTKIMLFIDGTNTTETPILRYGATQFYIVSPNVEAIAIQVGDLRDGYLMDLYVKDLSEYKPGTAIPYIYLGRMGNSYDELVATPIFLTRNKEQRALRGSLNYYTDLGLPYIESTKLIVNDQDLLDIDINKVSYGNQNLGYEHIFLSSKRLKWKRGQDAIEELATLRDIAELALGDQFMRVLIYCRDTITAMNSIDDSIEGDTCLVLENNTIYVKGEASWEVQEVLNYNLTTDNGKYFDIEDLDGDNSGKAIWNVKDGGKFQTFTDYSNSIDNDTIVRDHQTRAIEVAKVPFSLTIYNLDANGNRLEGVEFDGSSSKEFEVKVDFSKFYDKEDIESYYNGSTVGNLAEFYEDSIGNTKIRSTSIVTADVVTFGSEDSFLQAKGNNVTAQQINYSKDGFGGTSVKSFLDQNFAYQDKDNEFTVDQTIKGETIVTQPWVENTFYSNNFNKEVVSNMAIQLNSPAQGDLALRITKINLYDKTSTNEDIQLPVVNSSNAGVTSPEQMTLWNKVIEKVDISFIKDGISQSIYNNEDGLKIERKAENGNAGSYMEFGGTSSEPIFKLTVKNNDESARAILTIKPDGVYITNTEGIESLSATQAWTKSVAVLKENIVTDMNEIWGEKKVVLGDVDFTEVGPSNATYTIYGSNVESGTMVSKAKQFPIVTKDKAGLATAAMFNQIDENKAAIANLQGQGYVGAELPDNPTSDDVEDAWDNAKPTIPSVEGSSLLDLNTGNTWRKLDVAGTLVWCNLGVLGGVGQATNATAGIVKGSPEGAGTIFVENDATMTVNGWDELMTDIQNIDLDINELDTSFTNHISDMVEGQSSPHVTPTDREHWNEALTKATAAIPKVSSATNNNFAMWNSGGVIKDNGLSLVTDFATVSDLTIPTTKAVADKTWDASKIVSGIFDKERMPNLDASKITSGSFDKERIPNLDASKITSGALSTARGGLGVDASLNGTVLEWLSTLEWAREEMFRVTGVNIPFAEKTPAQIKYAADAIAKGGNPSNYKVNLGDEINIPIDGVNYTFEVIGFNHDTKADGSKAGISLAMKNLLATTYPMNSSNTNKGGWPATLFRTTTIPTLLAQFPEEWKTVMATTKKLTANGGNQEGVTVVETEDKLWLLSSVECFGINQYSHEGEGTQYELYNQRGWANAPTSANPDRVKYMSNGSGSASLWWLRSPRATFATIFVGVGNAGYASSSAASNSGGVCLGFCI